MKKALLEAWSEVEAFEDQIVKILGEVTLKARIVMMKEYRAGGANAYDLDAAIAEYDGPFGVFEDDETAVVAKGDQAAQGRGGEKVAGDSDDVTNKRSIARDKADTKGGDEQ